MAKTVTSSSAITGEKMAPPSITLLPDKRSPTNGRSSPARTGKTNKKPQINGHASPSHLAANINNNHAGKQNVEGYMKTDDRMRLAKERREEREKSLAAREQLIREKERRARLQYERTVEERWRRLEEQRQKEELRRNAVGEKRRHQLEEDRERLEALMKRSLERSLQLEQRTKRWSRGCSTGAAPCSPHRSPFRGSLNPADHNRAGLQGGSQSTPNTPKKERLRGERRTASPGCGSPVRRSESPASVTRHLASPTTSKLASKMRAQSPSNAPQYHNSPTRHRPTLSPDDRKAEDKKVEKHSEQSKAEKKNADINSTNPSSQDEKNVVNTEIIKPRSSKGEILDRHFKGDTSEKNQSPDRKDHMSPKVDSSEKKTQSNAQDGDKKKESAPCSSTGKVAAGTTNAEEATRLLAERRRQARAQKELEEKKQEQEEEERLRKEQLRKQLAQEQRQQEAKAQQVKQNGKNEEDLHKLKQEEDKQKKEEQVLQTQMNKEREKAQVEAQVDTVLQRQDRELQKQQEEEERQLRKKRIEEIMKRTRKGEADLKKEEQVETKPVSPPGEVKTVHTNDQLNEQAIQKVEFQVKEQVSVNMQECAVVKKEAAAQIDNQKSLQVKNNTHQVTTTRSVPDKRPDTKHTTEEHGGQLTREGKACVLKHAFLLVVPIGRYTDNENQAACELTKIFGEDAVRQHTLVLFTRGDDLEGMGIEDYLRETAPAGLKALIERCGGRYHVLNNKDPSNSAQVKALLMKVGKMVKQTYGGFYTNAMFLEAEAAIREEQERMLRERGQAEGEEQRGNNGSVEEQARLAKRRKCDLEFNRAESLDMGSQGVRRRGLERGNEEEFRVERWTEESRGNPFSFLRDRVEQWRDPFRGRPRDRYRAVSRRQSLRSSMRREAALSAKVLGRVKILVAAGATGMAVGAMFGAAAPLAAAAGASFMGNSVGFAAGQLAGMSVAGGTGVGKAVGAIVAAASGKTAVALGAATGGVLGGSVGAVAGAEAASPREGALDALGQVSLIGASAVGLAAGVGGTMGAGAALGAALEGAAFSTVALCGAETASVGAAGVANASVAQSLASAAGHHAVASVGSVAAGTGTPQCAATGVALAQEMAVNVPVAAGYGSVCGLTGPSVASVASRVVSDPWGTVAVSTRIMTAVAEIGKAAAGIALAGGLVVKVVKEKVRCGTGTTEASYTEKKSYEVYWNK